jgi:tetratricopeptide (TPR) repeat protein
MSVLLADLGRDPARLRRRAALILGVATVGAAGAFLVARSTKGELCLGSERDLAGVWDSGTAHKVRDAFLATGSPLAEDAFRQTSAALDRYAGAWVAMSTESCRATRVRGLQSDALMQLRANCLDRHRNELRALGGLFAHADALIVEKATAASQALDLRECADAVSLAAPVPPPADPVARAKVSALRARLDVVKAGLAAGHYAEAIAEARRVAVDARPLAYKPLDAEVSYLTARLTTHTGSMPDASETARQAIWAAEAGRDDRTVAEVRTFLLYVDGYLQAKYDQVTHLARDAEVAVERLGGDEALEAQRLNYLGAAQTSAGSLTEAKATLERAAALHEKLFGADDLRTLESRQMIGTVLERQGRYDEAIALLRPVLAASERALGQDHPLLSATLTHLSVDMKYLGRFADAVAYAERAVAISRRSADSGRNSLPRALSILALAYEMVGRLDDAVAATREGLTLAEKVYGAGSPHLGVLHGNLGEFALRLGRYAEARDEFEQTRKLNEKLAPGDPSHGVLELDFAELARLLGKPAEAAERAGRALRIFETNDTPREQYVVQALTIQGQAYVSLGQPARALTALERAQAIRLKRPSSPAAAAGTEFALARALWDSGRDRQRAAALAQSARAKFASDPEGEAVVVWQKTHHLSP